MHVHTVQSVLILRGDAHKVRVIRFLAGMRSNMALLSPRGSPSKEPPVQRHRESGCTKSQIDFKAAFRFIFASPIVSLLI